MLARTDTVATLAQSWLAQFEAEQLKTLMTRGYMAAIYAHIASLSNFQRLLERRASIAARQGQA